VDTGDRSDRILPKPLAWFRELQQQIQTDYDELHANGRDDPQRTGHGGETTWKRTLEDWLPPSYEIGTRKYILPEVGDDCFETDLVVFSPAYPAKLRQRHEVMAGGVAAAFSVKLTLDAAGTRDAVNRAARLRQGLHPRLGTLREELFAPMAAGLLAHSHAWKAARSMPVENVAASLEAALAEFAHHPRDVMDYACVADLTSWFTFRALLGDNVNTAIMTSFQHGGSAPVGEFVTGLLSRLALNDPLLTPWADALRMTGATGTGSGSPRRWPVDEVLSQAVIDTVRHGRGYGRDWTLGYFF